MAQLTTEATIDEALAGEAAHDRRPNDDPSARLDPVRHAYSGAGQRWAHDAMLAYGPLAGHLVERCPVALRDLAVLDAGAGTGAAGTVLVAEGARVVACDLELDMLRRHPGGRDGGCAAVVDVTALSFRGGSFDVAVAAFVLNHLADPLAGLGELARVTRRGGVVLASAFGEARAPAKEAVDQVLAARGWQPPEWYQAMQRRAAALATQDRMSRVARRAGLIDIEVDGGEIDVGLDDAALVVRHRFGMPHVSGFLESLSESARAAVVADATRAVEQTHTPYRPVVVELVARIS